MNRFLKSGILVAFLFFIFSIFFRVFLGPVSNSSESLTFIVPENQLSFNTVEALAGQELIKNKKLTNFIFFVFRNGKVEPGGYRLTKNMNTLRILKKISRIPDLVWLTTVSCQRKEQIGEKLAKALDWNSEKLTEWNNLYKTEDTDYFEGVYYPDTYLIPVEETSQQVAQRFINRFNEKFAPLADGFIAKNIKWTTGLKIASLIAREAGGTPDMNIISGIIWNRLDLNMPLQIDATMQYTLGKKTNGNWWGTISLEQKQNDSAYNSYLHKGLPPTPICSPDTHAIEAALNPTDTDCLYYLHDSISQIHCAETYAEHLVNIKEYLD